MFELMRRLPLFDGFSDVDLMRLATTVREQRLEAGEVLFFQGEEGNECYVILSGQMEVLAHPGRAEVRVFNPSPLAALMVCEPSEGRRLADQVLGAVLRLPAEDRTTLLDTLDAYLDHEGSAERAGEVLYCHPNTVRYRLRRLQELTGRSLTDPHGIAELATAAYAVRLGSATALWHGQPAPAPNGRVRSGL